MTAAVAGAAARSAGGRAAATGAARSTATRSGASGAPRRAPTRSGRAPRPDIDERSDRAGERFRERYSRPGAAEKKTPKETPEATPERSLPSVNVSMPGAVSSGAGFVLAFFFWTWVALPFLKDGPEGVKKMMRAKFTNKRPDGSYLP